MPRNHQNESFVSYVKYDKKQISLVIIGLALVSCVANKYSHIPNLAWEIDWPQDIIANN